MRNRGGPARILVAAPPRSGIVATLRGIRDIEVWRVTDEMPQLVAAAAAGLGSLAVLHADLPDVDRTCVDLIRRHGLGVVGVLGTRTTHGLDRLARLGFGEAVFDDSPPAEVGAVLRRVLANPSAAEPAAPAPPPPLPAGLLPGQWRQVSPLSLAGGGMPRRLVAVWGPTGAPGRSTITTTLAAVFAARATRSLIVDVDPYGGAQSAHFGLLDEAPGLVAAVRAADRGDLDQAGLESLLIDVGPRLSLLTGLPGPDRWPQVRPAPLEQVLRLCRGAARVVVADCGFSLEDDEELSYDTFAPRRNAATHATLAEADDVVVVGRADRLGVRRLATSLPELRRRAPRAGLHVVLNRTRHDDGAGRLAAAARLLGVGTPHAIPDDPDAAAGALRAGRPLPDHSPGSPVVEAARRLADALVRGALRGGSGSPDTILPQAPGVPRRPV